MRVTLETERLLLPPLSSEHVASLAAVYADPDVNGYIGGEELNADGTARQVAAFEAIWREHGFGQSAVLPRESGHFIGRVGLHPWPAWDEIEVGWVLARSAQGHGYATEAAARWISYAFDTLGIGRLTAVIHPDNVPSQRVAARLGFRLHREDWTHGIDVLVFERVSGGDE